MRVHDRPAQGAGDHPRLIAAGFATSTPAVRCGRQFDGLSAHGPELSPALQRLLPCVVRLPLVDLGLREQLFCFPLVQRGMVECTVGDRPPFAFTRVFAATAASAACWA